MTLVASAIRRQAMNTEIDRLIVDPYMNIYRLVKEQNLFENEQAMQSAVASMYIRYNQLTDKNVHFNNLIKQLSDESKKRTEALSTPSETKPLNDVIRSVFAPLSTEYEKAGLYIEEKLKEPIYDYDQFLEGLRDYMHRNKLTFRFIAQLKPYEED